MRSYLLYRSLFIISLICVSFGLDHSILHSSELRPISNIRVIEQQDTHEHSNDEHRKSSSSSGSDSGDEDEIISTSFTATEESKSGSSSSSSSSPSSRGGKGHVIVGGLFLASAAVVSTAFYTSQRRQADSIKQTDIRKKHYLNGAVERRMKQFANFQQRQEKMNKNKPLIESNNYNVMTGDSAMV